MSVLRVGYQGHLVRATNLGVGGCILQLGVALANGRPGDEELVLYTGTATPWAQAKAQRGVEFVLRPGVGRWRLTRILWEQLVLPYRSTSDRLDLLHATGYVMPIATRIPTVLTIFDLLAINNPELCRPTTRLHYRLLLPPSARRARRIIVPSRAVRRELCEALQIPPSRVDVVLPGIHPRFYNEPQRAELAEVQRRYALPKRFILCPGNLEPKKNLERLVEAFHRARSAGLEGELILVGGPGWGTRFACPRPAADVRWLGYVPSEDLPLLYRLASEVAFPALAEGFGLPVVEAMASGTVIVASDVPAVEESDPEAVLRIDPLSVASQTEGLLAARRDRTLRKHLIKRGQRAASGFSWQQAAEATWRIYYEALER